MQRDDEVCLLHGLDLSTKARAVYLYSEELELSIQDAIDLAYAYVRLAEGNLDDYIRRELQHESSQHDTHAACQASVLSGGLTSLRLTLRAMVETPLDSGLWKSEPGIKP